MSPNASQISVRRAVRADAGTIAAFNIGMALETEGKRLDPATIGAGVLAVFDDPRRGEYFVAEVQRAVVGCLMITHEWSDWRNGDIWWIQSVYVDRDRRRQGVFKAMFDAVRTRAMGSGVVALRLYVERDNAHAQATYVSLGMRPAGYDVYHLAIGQSG